MYMAMTEDLAADMELLAHDVVAEESEAVFGLGDRIEELPYCALKKRHLHEYGTLKSWIKWKNFEEVTTEEHYPPGENHLRIKPESWKELKVRPLASYKHHLWRNLLSLCSRFCTTAVKELQWGFAAQNRREVAHDLREYSERMRGHEEEQGLSLRDIGDPFSNVDRRQFEFCVNQAIMEITNKDPKIRRF